MWKNMVEAERLQKTIWRMRIACWITKPTNTHPQYVILIYFPLQQWFHEHVPVLRITYVHYLYCLHLPSYPWDLSLKCTQQNWNCVLNVKFMPYSPWHCARKVFGPICNQQVTLVFYQQHRQTLPARINAVVMYRKRQAETEFCAMWSSSRV